MIGGGLWLSICARCAGYGKCPPLGPLDQMSAQLTIEQYVAQVLLRCKVIRLLYGRDSDCRLSTTSAGLLEKLERRKRLRALLEQIGVSGVALPVVQGASCFHIEK